MKSQKLSNDVNTSNTLYNVLMHLSTLNAYKCVITTLVYLQYYHCLLCVAYNYALIRFTTLNAVLQRTKTLLITAIQRQYVERLLLRITVEKICLLFRNVKQFLVIAKDNTIN